MKDENFNTIRTERLSNAELFGYPTLRLRREVVIRTLTTAVEKLGVTICYSHSFEKIIDEEPHRVRICFTNGVQVSSTFLVGADGIWSQVRSNAFQNSPKPDYTGQVALVWNVPCLELEAWIRNAGHGVGDSASATFMSTPLGVTIFWREDREKTFFSTGSYRPLAERSQDEWSTFASDREAIGQALRGGTGNSLPEPVKSSIDYIVATSSVSVSVWPMYILRPMEHMVSHQGSGRTILVGDAAHAFPPYGGQGVNMAIEDAESLALVLCNSGADWTLQKAPRVWEKWRMKRIEKVKAYTDEMRKSITKKKEQEEDAQQTSSKSAVGNWASLSWLYGYDVKADMEAETRPKQGFDLRCDIGLLYSRK